MFANVEEVKQKTAEALKGIKIDESKTILSSGMEVWIGVLHQTESTLKAELLQKEGREGDGGGPGTPDSVFTG